MLREPGSEVRRAFSEAAERLGLLPVIAVEIGSREGIIAAAAQNIGIALAFDEGLIPEQSVSKLRIRDTEVVAHVEVVCLEERKNNRAIGAFFAIAEELRPVQHPKLVESST